MSFTTMWFVVFLLPDNSFKPTLFCGLSVWCASATLLPSPLRVAA